MPGEASEQTLLFLGKSGGQLLYVENKIGDRLKKHFIEGVLRCLVQQKAFDKPSFAILTGREFTGQDWYVSELKQVLNEKRELSARVGSYIFYWEDIIEACVNV